MRKVLMLAAGYVITAAVAFGALGDVVASFRSPASQPYALAYGPGPQYLWVWCNTSPYYIYRMNAETGSIHQTMQSYLGYTTRGLCYQAGGYLWMGDAIYDRVLVCDSNNPMTIYKSIPVGHDMNGGLALHTTGDGGLNPSAFFTSVINPSVPHIYRNNLTTGSIMSSFKVATGGLMDLAWDWRNGVVYGGDPGSYRFVWGYNTNGSLVSSFLAPEAGPLGMCYSDGYLWVATCLNGRIWKIHCPYPGQKVAPASLGKVKALYR